MFGFHHLSNCMSNANHLFLVANAYLWVVERVNNNTCACGCVAARDRALVLVSIGLFTVLWYYSSQASYCNDNETAELQSINNCVEQLQSFA